MGAGRRDDEAEEGGAPGFFGNGEPPWADAARAADVWEADVIALETKVADDPGAEPAVVLVAAGGYVVHGEVLRMAPHDDDEAARAVEAAVRGTEGALGRLPARLRVRSEGVAAALAGALGARGVAVEASETLPGLDEAAMRMVGEGPGPGGPLAVVSVPETWAETGAEGGDVAALFRATGAFVRARPWEALADPDAFVATLPGGARWVVALMGAGGEPGLALYGDLETFLAAMGVGHPVDAFGPEGAEAVALTLVSRGDVPPEMLAEVEAAGWEVPAPDVYPYVMGVRLRGGAWTAAHVRDLAAVTAAVAALAASAGESGPAAAYTDAATGVRLEALEIGGEEEEP